MSKNLEELRQEIDAVDSEILKSFRRRMELSAEIASYKKANNIPVLDVDREKSKLDSIAKNENDELSAFVSRLYLTLADISKEYQVKVLESENGKVWADREESDT